MCLNIRDMRVAESTDEVIGWLFSQLRMRYGEKKLARERDLIGLLVKTVLSQNTNDLNRDRAYESLRSRFPEWEDLLKAGTAEIEKAIRVGGLAHQKAVRIKQILRRLKSEKGSVELDFLCKMPEEKAREYLLSFNGIGLKTASILLLFGCARSAFPVDTHIFRVSTRLGLVPKRASVSQAHRVLGEMVPREMAYELHINLIELGREICKARKPNCPECPLNKRCFYYLNEWEMQ